jgi:hypothetical protein
MKYSWTVDRRGGTEDAIYQEDKADLFALGKAVC